MAGCQSSATVIQVAPIDMASPFGNLTQKEFLRDYWQQRPLLIRDAFPDFSCPLSPDDLADMACAAEVPSRLILERDGDYPWEMRFGPFEPEDFADLPVSHWTLLVQETDRIAQAAADLLVPFRFLPNWRIDDVQISYAPEHGSAGPHVDNYDVFLLQGMGRRRWQIDHTPAPVDAPFVPDLDVALLEGFAADAEWVLSPGDMLYLPPRIPHWGTALEECMTISVGFRAPTHREIITGFLEWVAGSNTVDTYYGDAGLSGSLDPGRIRPEVLAYVRRVVESATKDTSAIDRWFGSHVTEPRRGIFPTAPPESYAPGDMVQALREGKWLRRSSIAYFAYFATGDMTYLYVCGQEFPLEETLAFAAPLLSGTAQLGAVVLEQHMSHPSFVKLLADLVNAGYLEWMTSTSQ